jgi:hypothetical protein
VRRVSWQTVEPTHFADHRKSAADGGGGVGFGQADEMGADDGGRGRDRDESVAGTLAFFASAWAAASAASPAGVSAGSAAATAAAAASGGRIAPGPTSVRFGGLTSMILRFAGGGPDVALHETGSASIRVIGVWLDGWDGDWPMWHDEKCQMGARIRPPASGFRVPRWALDDLGRRTGERSVSRV